MTTKKVVYTTYGRYARYDVIKASHFLLSPDFYVYRDGEYVASYSSLRAAVEAADAKARK